MQQIPLRRIGAPRSVPAAAAAGMRVTEVRPRSEPIGEASSEAGWHIKRRPKEAEVYQLLRPTEKTYDALDRIVETVLPGVNEKGNKRVQKMRYGITDEGLSYTETTDPEGNIGVQYADA